MVIFESLYRFAEDFVAMQVEELAGQLIRFSTESPPGNEEECARFLRDYIQDRVSDFDVRLHQFAPNRANLVARVGPEDRPGLLLSGHIDVVPAGDHRLWKGSPFEPRVEGGRLYGRGAADMKGSVASIVKALEVLSGTKPQRRVVFVATAGEEIGYDGLKELIREGGITSRDGKYGVIGEPTELRVIRGHKGGSLFRIGFVGRSAHSSRPELGINAIEKASVFIRELLKWGRVLAMTKHRELGITLLNPTVLHGGTKNNVIPEYCELTVDCRRIPAHSAEYIRKGMMAIIKKLKEKDEKFNATVELTFDNDPLLVPKNHTLVRLAEEVAGSQSTVAPYGTEAPAYQRLGIPTVILGPGSVREAHIPDEFVDLAQLRKAVSVYAGLIKKVCL